VRLGGRKSGDHVAHRSNSQVSRPRVAGNQQSGSPKKIMHTKSAKCRSEMIDRMDIHITLAPHICIVSRGSALGLWRARVNVYHSWCKHECDELKVGAATSNST
jgi:hypothetical protein